MGDGGRPPPRARSLTPVSAMTHRPEPKLQFSIQAVLWIIFTLAMVLAYVRTADLPSLRMGAVYLALGLVVGWAAGRLVDALFWALLNSMLAYLSVLGGSPPNAAVAYGWGVVAAACGSLCGVRKPRSVLFGALFSGWLGMAAMLGCLEV